MKRHDGVEGIQSWGARALSIVTYESAKLREEAKKAGAKMSWLMGLSDDMEAAQKARIMRATSTKRTTSMSTISLACKRGLDDFTADHEQRVGRRTSLRR